MTPIVYQDFELRIELIPGTDNRYRTRVINSPVGQANGEFDLPFSDQELDSLRHVGLPALETVQEFGRTLFDLVFANKIEICLRRSLDAVHRENERLRLRLCLTDAPKLADLPWEYLYDTTQNRFLVQFTNTPVVRSLSLPRPISPLTVQPPLRMLVMIANPRDHNFGQLNVEDEWNKIQAALDSLQKRNLITVTLLEAATLGRLQCKLRRSHYHIFHYIGHGGFDRATNEGGLLLEDEYRKSQLVTSRKLAPLLCDHPSLRLIMLNACSGARTTPGAPFVSLAQHLMEQGVPAVIAMQFDITDTSATILAEEFYNAIADSYPIEAALTEARKRIFSNGSDVEWGTPVLYLHAKNGQLFDVTNQYQVHQPEQYQPSDLQLQSLHDEYTNWHKAQNEWFQRCLQNEVLSQTSFRQVIRAADVIERQELWSSLDNWFSNWRQEEMYVLLGEENSGKTWGVAAWLDRKISQEENFPPVVFLPAADVGSNNPEKLLLEAIKPHDKHISAEQWQQYVTKWLAEQSVEVPTLLLVVDGIDDEWHGSNWWQQLLESIKKDGVTKNKDLKNFYIDETTKNEQLKNPYIRNIAVIVTCGTKYWTQHYHESPGMPEPTFILSSDNRLNKIPTTNLEQIRQISLLFVGRLIDACTDVECNLMVVATSWLMNQDKHLLSDICKIAVLHALPLPYIAQKVKVILLLSWINSNSSRQDIENLFITTLIENIDSYLALYEYLWIKDPANRKAQDLMVSAFLHWYSRSLQVRMALEKIVERWLGMVHIAGFPQQRGNESQRTEDVKARIAQRVGFTLQLGDFTYAGRTLTAIDDDNLLRLGRAALAIISHFPRGPFVHSIATGCVAEAIMDRPDKYDLFRWVLTTASESVWAEVQHEVARLLAFDSPVAQQAASRLLSFEGSKQSHELDSTLPSNLFPEHFLHSEHKKDPCRSWFAWNKEVCETCLQRADLEAQYIARRMETHALDPSLTVPDELRQRFTELAETISIDQIWSTMFTGVQDLAFEQFEPALCAVAPQAIGNVVRQIVQTTSVRSGLALRQISFRLREHALLFEQEEMQSIYLAWQLLCQSAETWQEEQEMAEMMLFAPVLLNLKAEQQLAHLLQRPNAGSDLLQYEKHFHPIQDWVFVEGLLQNITDERSLLRFLWFISVHAKQIPSGFLFACVMPYVESPSAQVRCLVLQIIHNSQNQYLGLAVVGGWKRDPNNLDGENFPGSLILCKYGSLLTIEDLCQRIDPSYLGDAVLYRGNHPSEVNYFAQKIHTLWQHISNQRIDVPQNLPQATIDISTRANRDSAERSMLSISRKNQERIQWRASDQTWGGNDDNRHLYPVFPTDEEINEQRARDAAIIQAEKEQEIAAGNPWFARRFNTAALEHVIVKHPDLLEQWLQAVSEQNPQRLRILQRCHSFYEALCVVLLQYSPEKGVNLYLQMERMNLLSRDAQTRWQFVDQALFRTNPVGVIDELWKKKLQACTTDAQLLTLASMLQWGAGKEWLWAYIDQQLESNTPLGISRGITLLGYYDSDIAQGRLNELLSEAAPDTWIKQLLENSINRWHLNAWSRHWFSRIFSSDTNVDAWAAFRLFLRCVDSRFWIWYEQVKQASSVYPNFERRRQHIEINWETIRNRIRKNEDSFEKQLFGQKILQKQAWPWM